MKLEGIKINSANAPRGPDGQIYLKSGQNVALRLWQKESDEKDEKVHSRAYETVGYVLNGRAELTMDGETVTLEPGDSWIVPAGASHTYKILEPLTALEATSPPAREAHLDT